MIQFVNTIDYNKLRPAFNNDIIEFYSTTEQPTYAGITGQGLNLILYPNPNGYFRINMKEYVKGLMNAKFNDNLETSLQSPNPESFVYTSEDGTDNGVYLGLRVTFTINFEDDTTESATYDLSWIAAVQQIEDYKPMSKLGVNILSPFKAETANKHYIKYWQGYPFDVSIYYDSLYLKLKNNTNLLSADFEVDIYINRFFFSDGRTDETIEDVLPISDGFNEIRILPEGEEHENDKFLIVDKVPYDCGVYLKWFNPMGGYSYWLFENTAEIERSVKETGSINTDFYNIENSRGNEVITGKESRDEVKVSYQLATEDERDIIKTIIDSPKIYLFTGKPYSQNSYKNWIEITLKTSRVTIKNPKEKLTNFSLEFELPKRYTQTL